MTHYWIVWVTKVACTAMILDIARRLIGGRRKPAVKGEEPRVEPDVVPDTPATNSPESDTPEHVKEALRWAAFEHKAELLVYAASIFDGQIEAAQWLTKPHPYFHGRTPLRVIYEGDSKELEWIEELLRAKVNGVFY